MIRSAALLAITLCPLLGVGFAAAEPLPLSPQVLSVLRPNTDSWSGWLRCRACRDTDWVRYGVRLDDNWQLAEATQPVVILVHGFNSTPRWSENLIGQARASGLPCGVFAYPNDQPLRDSAEFLSAVLNQFAELYPTRRVALVTHSMGGLVARECVEDQSLRPPSVDQLVMVAPPTHGSMLAHYAVGLDVWEHWLRREGGSPTQRVRASIADGLSEAPTDLQPGSTFLKDLNARARAPGVRYAILLGSRAQLSESQRYCLRQTISKASDMTPGWQADAEEIERIVAKLDEVVHGRGDGAVAISRGRLEGVHDTHVLPFSHLSVVREDNDQVTRQVHQMILTRLLSEG